MSKGARLFVMAGGGTGGHVIPGIAVARELCRKGHEVLFVGTERGAEARLVPQAGFRFETIRVGGIKNLGILTRLVSLWRLAAETAGQVIRFGKWEPSAVFSMGGYVAGPPVLAALLRNVPVVVMEPNAVPGFTNRHISRWITRALVSFPETIRFFPRSRTELTGLPVREEFFELPAKEHGDEEHGNKDQGAFTILITGGSQGSRTLNDAAIASWPLFRNSGLPVRFLHQSGLPMHFQVAGAFSSAGLDGEVTAFISDMPAAFAAADLIVSRSGAGAVSEIAAAGRPSILIPFPFAADQHQLRNAEAFQNAGAALMYRDSEWTGQRFFETVAALFHDRVRLGAMGTAARTLAHRGAARRAAEILVEAAGEH